MGADLRRITTVLTLSLGAAGCVAGEQAPHASSPAALSKAPPADDASQAPRAEQAAAAERPTGAQAVMPVLINAVDAPAAPAALPAITIKAPQQDQVIPRERAADFEVQIQAQGGPGSAKGGGGGFLHVVLDNQPFKAIPWTQGKLRMSEIAAPLQEGHHVLVAFPASDKHLAVHAASGQPAGGKRPAAIVSFWVGAKGEAPFDPAAPLLVFNMPSGTYSGLDTDAIALDFYVLNAEIGPGKHTVHATVTPQVGEPRSITINSWQPFHILGVPHGRARVHLELRDPDGVIVPGPWNNVDRTITVDRASGGEVSRAP